MIKITLVCLCTVLCLSTAVPVSALTHKIVVLPSGETRLAEAYEYHKENLPKGQSVTSKAYKKESTGHLTVCPETQTAGVKVQYGGRNKNNTVTVTEVQQFNMLPNNGNPFTCAYKPGYGEVGKYYCFRAYNNNETQALAAMSGSWAP